MINGRRGTVDDRELRVDGLELVLVRIDGRVLDDR